MGLNGALCGGLGGTEGMRCPQAYSCVPGAPGGGSHHFLPLWGAERITPSPHLTFTLGRAMTNIEHCTLHILSPRAPSGHTCLYRWEALYSILPPIPRNFLLSCAQCEHEAVLVSVLLL